MTEMRPAPERFPVQVNIKGTTYAAHYEVSDPFLVVISPYGTLRAVLGLAKPRKLAKHLLKVLVARVAAEMPSQPFIDSARGKTGRVAHTSQ